MRVLLFIALLFFTALGVSMAQSSRGPIAETSGPVFCKQVEKQTFLLVNQYRQANDFPALAWSDGITKTARAHSKDMATGESDFGHEGFSGRISHLRESMPGIWGAGENVLYTSQLDDVAKQAVQLWLHSPHHLKNIRGDYNYSGLGVWQDKDGVLYFTQIFVKVKPPAKETQSAPAPTDTSLMGLFANPNTRPAR